MRPHQLPHFSMAGNGGDGNLNIYVCLDRSRSCMNDET